MDQIGPNMSYLIKRKPNLWFLNYDDMNAKQHLKLHTEVI